MRDEAFNKILTDLLCATPNPYLGLFSGDELPRSFPSYPSAYVANNDPSSLGALQWVAFYHLSPTHLEFFDPYGCPPDEYQFPIPTTIVVILRLLLALLEDPPPLRGA